MLAGGEEVISSPGGDTVLGGSDHMLVGGSSFKRLEVPAGVPDDLKGWYALREVYISPESTASVDVHSPQLTKRVQEDFLSLSPLYHLLRGAYEAVPPEEVDKMVQKMRR